MTLGCHSVPAITLIILPVAQVCLLVRSVDDGARTQPRTKFITILIIKRVNISLGTLLLMAPTRFVCKSHENKRVEGAEYIPYSHSPLLPDAGFAKGLHIVDSQLKRFVSLNGHVPRDRGYKEHRKKSLNQIAKGGSISTTWCCPSYLMHCSLADILPQVCCCFVVLCRLCGLSDKCALALHWLFQAHSIGRVIR